MAKRLLTLCHTCSPNGISFFKKRVRIWSGHLFSLNQASTGCATKVFVVLVVTFVTSLPSSAN
ncbi:hypothetical protein KCP77_23960 [Salmonella enterica subsp. enterica]|nr:hypothetical protein KCP77_23960 [Salmonella enterica subsp. enterica]